MVGMITMRMRRTVELMRLRGGGALLTLIVLTTVGFWSLEVPSRSLHMRHGPFRQIIAAAKEMLVIPIHAPARLATAEEVGTTSLQERAMTGSPGGCETRTSLSVAPVMRRAEPEMTLIGGVVSETGETRETTTTVFSMKTEMESQPRQGLMRRSVIRKNVGQ